MRLKKSVVRDIFILLAMLFFIIEGSKMIRRKDSRGRVLNDGETQRTDGRYAYQYTDAFGDRKMIYSWKLLPSDKTPTGKRKGLSLREKEKQIRDAMDSGILPYGGNMTVLELVERYVSQKTGVRHNTKANYNFVINVIKKEAFGTRRIDKIKLSDAKAWLIKLQADGRGYSSIHSIRGVVRPAFQMAVDDDLLVKNPFEFQLATVVVNDSVTREALTRKQERQFLDFVKDDSHFCKYYEGVFILFKTGMRISEFVGLTISDLDMKGRKIIIDHQLQRTRDMQYVIEDTKTTCGVREIPMTVSSRSSRTGKDQRSSLLLTGGADSSFLTRTICRWWPCTGRSISNISGRSITRSIRSRCQKSLLMYAVIRSAVIWQSPV